MVKIKPKNGDNEINVYVSKVNKDKYINANGDINVNFHSLEERDDAKKWEGFNLALSLLKDFITK